MKHFLFPLLMAGICVTVLYVWTGGFRAFTVFSYTLHQAGQMPRSFPDIGLMNQDGESFHLKDEGKFVLINFVYLNCPDVCHRVNNRLETIYHLIPPGLFVHDLQFITLSFDPERDDVERIKKYRKLYEKEDISGWDFAVPGPVIGKDLQVYLKQAGIWAVPAPANGMINHSVYIFLVSPDNKVVATFDPARETDSKIAADIQSAITQGRTGLHRKSVRELSTVQ